MLHLTPDDKLMLVEVAIPYTDHHKYVHQNWKSRGPIVWIEDLEFKPECIIVTPHPEEVRPIVQNMVSQHCKDRKKVRWLGKWRARPVTDHIRCVRIREIEREQLSSFNVAILRKPLEAVPTNSK